MKIRQGFVSNSSSSSFIIQLNKPIENYVYEEFLEDYNLEDSEYASYLFRDLKNVSKSNEALEDIENNLCVTLYRDNICDEDFEKIEIEMKKTAKKVANKILKEHKKNNTYILEYSDDDGSFHSYMEHEFVPSFEGTKEQISHH